MDSWLLLLGILMKWVTNVGGILQTLHGLCLRLNWNYNLDIGLIKYKGTIYILWEALLFIYYWRKPAATYMIILSVTLNVGLKN